MKTLAPNQIGSIQQAFEQFERNVVRVPPAENDAAKEVHPQIRESLDLELPEHQETFLSGSYSRKVQAVKLKDIDIIVVLDDPEGKFRASAAAALAAIREAALASELVRSASIRVRSVRLTLRDHEFTVDLVAALEPIDGEYGLLLARHIREEGRDDWTLANPRGQRQAAIDKNAQCDGIYVPTVRLVKYWLGTVWGDGDKPFRSYHAESILHRVLSEKVDYAQAMVMFFDAAYAALAPGVLTPDPGAPLTNVDERLDSGERRHAREAVANAREAARAAFAKQDVGLAFDAWVQVFGTAFPAPSTSPDKVFAAMASRTAGVVGAGIQVGRGRPVIESRPWRESADEAAVGRRLRRARIAAGLSQAQVADSLGISRPAVSLLEAGRRSLNSVELAKLARLYGKPATAFLFEPDDKKVLQYFRAEASVSEPDQAVVGEAVEWCRYYAMLEESVHGEQRFNLPIYPVPQGLAIDQGAHLAEQERRRLALGDAPITSMIDLLEHEGVKVLLRPFPPESKVSGCYFFSPEIGPCVLINSAENPSRQRFTAAHEYAHFLVDRQDIHGEICDTARHREPFEMRANAFAAAFLLPAGGVQVSLLDLGAEPRRVEAEHAVHLMYHFGVSYEAVLWRLVNLDWITREERQRMAATSPAALSRALGYHREPGAEPEPNRWRTIAIEAWRLGEISLGKLSELLNVPQEELRRVLTRPDDSQRRPARAPAAEPDWL